MTRILPWIVVPLAVGFALEGSLSVMAGDHFSLATALAVSAGWAVWFFLVTAVWDWVRERRSAGL